MENWKFKKMLDTKPSNRQSLKHYMVWKIVKGELKVNNLKKDKNLTKNQYKKILSMEG
jgi:hypothetical protein